MKYLLSPENQELVMQHARTNVLVAFDYDGTLSPIVQDREHAPMRASTRELLAKTAELYPCAIITGRSWADVSRYLKGISLCDVIGNHGLEPNERMVYFEQLVSVILGEIKPLLGHVQGVELENKRYSLAVHYRRSNEQSAACQEVMRAVESLSIPTRTIPGKLVINILPEGAPHKGDALQDLVVRCSADGALYVGDDVTDEDVFGSDLTGRLLTVRVGESSQSGAQFYLRDQFEIDSLLLLLVRSRNQDRRSDDEKLDCLPKGQAHKVGAG